jgi:hypothetical protein
VTTIAYIGSVIENKIYCENEDPNKILMQGISRLDGELRWERAGFGVKVGKLLDILVTVHVSKHKSMKLYMMIAAPFQKEEG